MSNERNIDILNPNIEMQCYPINPIYCSLGKLK